MNTPKGKENLSFESINFLHVLNAALLQLKKNKISLLSSNFPNV